MRTKYRQPFIHVRMPMVIVVVTNVQKRGTTILTGIPPPGGILLFWLTMIVSVSGIKGKVTIDSPGVCVKKHMKVVNQNTGQFITMKKFAGTTVVSHYHILSFSLYYSPLTDTWVWLYAYLDIDDEVSTEAACTGSDRVWAQPWLHSVPACLVLPPVPECKKAGWTRVNHLGNGRDGVPLNYTWRLPHFPSGSSQRCVLRLR